MYHLLVDSQPMRRLVCRTLDPLIWIGGVRDRPCVTRLFSFYRNTQSEYTMEAGIISPASRDPPRDKVGPGVKDMGGKD